MKAYKLTDEYGKTKNNTQWGEGIEHTAVAANKNLCTDGWIHFYCNPIIAVLMNPKDANFSNPQLWECETSGEHVHEPLKSGCKTLKTIKQIPLPQLTLINKVAFGILCAKETYKKEKWTQWADNWLINVDRTKKSALNAVAYATAAYAATYSTYAAPYVAAVFAANAAANAANAYSDPYATYSTYAAPYVANAAANAANANAVNNCKINFIKLAEQCLTVK